MKLSELTLILNILNDEEKELYKVFFKSSNGKPSKAEQLFDYLVEHPKVAEKKVIEIFYGKSKSAASAFSHLKTKL
ncbi:MAG: hypothetical protein NZ522_01010, partial [Chitinophagales bacterium]|nr:hypothetical protein [Chitinophagales bacterium]